MTKISIENVSRRGLLKGAGIGAGLVLSAPLLSKNSIADMMMGKPTLSDSAYLSIDLDGTAHIFIHRVEMGQGSRTGLPQVVADELEADWDRLVFEPAYGDKKFGDQNTDGSTSIRKFYTIFRKAGAAARMMLEQAAAQEWGVTISDVVAKKHRITNKLNGKSEDYAHFVAAASKLPVPKEETITLKAKKDHTFIGKSQPNIYLEDMVKGTATFGQDIIRDNMLYAIAVRPPSVGGVLKSYDKDAAMAVSGVVDVVELPALEKPVMFKPLGGVAVLATNTWAAKMGAEALNATFDAGENGTYNTTDYEKELWAAIDGPGTVFLKRGDVDTALSAAAVTMKHDYFVPHLSHAPMEPPAATAEWKGDKLSIWTCCQDPQSVQDAVAPFVGKKPEEIYVEATLLGGAFGRKSKPDFAVEAAILAQKVGRPVKMVWTREDDIRHDYYRTISAQRVEVALDDNKLVAFKHKVAYPSIMSLFNPAVEAPVGFELNLGLTDIPFEIPNLQVEAGAAKAEVRIGWLRSVCNIQQAFAIGSMVDEIAQTTGKNTADAWMEFIGSDRHVNPADDGGEYSNYGAPLADMPVDTARLKAVLAKAVEMSGYGKKMPKGKGLGLSVHRSFLTYAAAVAEVEVLDDGTVKVPHMWLVLDCGQVVNPDRVIAQLEGSAIFGLSIALYSEITAENGAIVEGNFDGYRLARMSESPVVETFLMDHDAAPGGVGEPGVPPVAPAITNAIFAATGKRIRRLPVKDQLV